MRCRCVLLALAVAAGLLAGCGGKDEPASIGDAVTATPTSTTIAPTSTTAGAPTTTVVSPTTTAAPTGPTGPRGSAPGTLVPGTGLPGTAPCTTEAVKEALTAANLEFSDPPKFACESIWAYAYAKIPKENSAPPQVNILQANGPRWAVVDKATACTGPAVAPQIRQIACPGY